MTSRPGLANSEKGRTGKRKEKSVHFSFLSDSEFNLAECVCVCDTLSTPGGGRGKTEQQSKRKEKITKSGEIFFLVMKFTETNPVSKLEFASVAFSYVPFRWVS